MPIGPITMFAVYIVCWWTTLFALLPLGMNQGARDRPTGGAAWGAPETPNMKRKLITTTWVSALVWLVIMAVLYTGVLTLPELAPDAYSSTPR